MSVTYEIRKLVGHFQSVRSAGLPITRVLVEIQIFLWRNRLLPSF
jgi:hypothetical protein